MLGEGCGYPEKKHPGDIRCSWAKNRKKSDADDDKQASMTMNKRERSSHTPLYGIPPVSRGFAPTSKSTCRNICRILAKYMQSTCKKCSRLWAPFP